MSATKKNTSARAAAPNGSGGPKVDPKLILWVLVGFAVIAVLVFAFKPKGGGVVNVDAAGAQEAIDAGAQIVDVRTAGEYQMGHIPGAVNVPVDQIATSAQSWDRDKAYLVYCATGARSATAVQTMQSMGFTDIKHFAAGIQAWNGKLDTGGASSSGAKIPTNGKPVFVEFYTDS